MAKRVNMSILTKSSLIIGFINRKLRKKASEKIESSKALLLRDFKAHPVTREIEGGAGSPNISNTLGGYGNYIHL